MFGIFLRGRGLTTLLAVLGTLCFPTAGRSWGPAGHRVVARIAQHHLKPMTLKRVHILAGRDASLADLAVWADTVREERPETKSWHYIHIPPSAMSLDLHRYCPDDDCLPVQLRKAIGIVRLGMRKEQERLDALRFLIHFAADLHQPLQTADRRGNDIPVIFLGQESSLHRFWDSGLLDQMIDDEAALAERLNGSITPHQKKEWSRLYINDWTWESRQLAVGSAYGGLSAADPKPIDDAYAAEARSVIEEQLAKAGIRLAAILNDIWSY